MFAASLNAALGRPLGDEVLVPIRMPIIPDSEMQVAVFCSLHILLHQMLPFWHIYLLKIYLGHSPIFWYNAHPLTNSYRIGFTCFLIGNDFCHNIFLSPPKGPFIQNNRIFSSSLRGQASCGPHKACATNHPLPPSLQGPCRGAVVPHMHHSLGTGSLLCLTNPSVTWLGKFRVPTA